jgi:hypothetical protein
MMTIRWTAGFAGLAGDIRPANVCIPPLTIDFFL